MIQLSMLEHVHKGAPGKTQDIEKSNNSSFESIMQLLNVQEDGEEKEQDQDQLTSSFDMLQQPLAINHLQPEIVTTEGKGVFNQKIPENGLLTILQKGAPPNTELDKLPDLDFLREINSSQVKPKNINQDEILALRNKLNALLVENGQKTEGQNSFTAEVRRNEMIMEVNIAKKGLSNAEVPTQSIAGSAVEVELAGKSENQFTGRIQSDELAVEQKPMKVEAELGEVNPKIGEQVMHHDKGTTIRADHFERDIKHFIQTTIHSQAAAGHKAASKPVINVQNLVNGTEAVIKLSPEHLGNVEVKLHIHEGHVKAEFLASTTHGKELLETQLNTLRAALESQGLQVGKIEISQQQNSSFLGGFSQKGDTPGRQSQQESRKRGEDRLIKSDGQQPKYMSGDEWVSQINTTA
ncbi:flagellar hook-length control protein FliK [Neobacillus notoginsengisoli]|uniref:Flagellar hook-length control protein FliK n=1 Tax=Neobacillus notoginsengisoli TaxID=1578198 RepID=A0A417YJS2_9BACI|nr:flagellar hook-length control protein FliK [Neobacillus notoginsengisoli]RHW33318.1 flagellar hook-length control protein FliK [Neobacillus notoginsengisoli]